MPLRGARPDVCAVFPNRQGCPKVGWTFAFNTALLPDGTHTLAVLATAGNARHYAATSTFSIANNTASNPIRITIDSPGLRKWAVERYGFYFTVGHTNEVAIRKVAVSVDGISYATRRMEARVQTFARSIRETRDAPNVGLGGTLDTTLFTDGPHALEITATGADGAGNPGRYFHGV